VFKIVFHRSPGLILGLTSGLALVFLFATTACHRPMQRTFAKPGANSQPNQNAKKGTSCDFAKAAQISISKLKSPNNSSASVRKDLNLAEMPPVVINHAVTHHLAIISQAADKTFLANFFIDHDSCSIIYAVESELSDVSVPGALPCPIEGSSESGDDTPALGLLRIYEPAFPSPYEKLYGRPLMEIYSLTKNRKKLSLRLYEKAASENKSLENECRIFMDSIDRSLISAESIKAKDQP
jgi:hypothetical protein